MMYGKPGATCALDQNPRSPELVASTGIYQCLTENEEASFSISCRLRRLVAGFHRGGPGSSTGQVKVDKAELDPVLF
jgi:hypothetical protein